MRRIGGLPGGWKGLGWLCSSDVDWVESTLVGRLMEGKLCECCLSIGDSDSI
jgi:hypothetical protein